MIWLPNAAQDLLYYLILKTLLELSFMSLTSLLQEALQSTNQLHNQATMSLLLLLQCN